jgi:hypothetical protein
MKSALLCSMLLVLSACATSGSKLITEQTLGCDQGQDLDILAGLQLPSKSDSRGVGEDRAVLLVNVANNSNHDIYITRITSEQLPGTGTSTYVLDRGYGKFDELIEPGKEHDFEVPMTGRAARFQPQQPGLRGEPPQRMTTGDEGLLLAVKVTTSTCDSYLCRFVVQAPL